MKTVRIYGMAGNLHEAPSTIPPGVEVWCCNNPKRAYRYRQNGARHEYTRWFNMHSVRHMTTAYPRGWEWFKTAMNPIVLQEAHPDIPTSVRFPKEAVLKFFGHTFFTFSAAWMIALAILEGFERIELYGFMLRDKPCYSNKECYEWERPCFFYWVEEARRHGVQVQYPEVVGVGEAGNPHEYTGPLYGYETT